MAELEARAGVWLEDLREYPHDISGDVYEAFEGRQARLPTGLVVAAKKVG